MRITNSVHGGRGGCEIEKDRGYKIRLISISSYDKFVCATRAPESEYVRHLVEAYVSIKRVCCSDWRSTLQWFYEYVAAILGVCCRSQEIVCAG